MKESKFKINVTCWGECPYCKIQMDYFTLDDGEIDNESENGNVICPECENKFKVYLEL